MTERVERPPGIAPYSKVLVGAVLFLILAGSLVTSTGSGLAVPDWPLSYGTLFPPMVGGIFYEHGHRLVATTVGVLVVVQTVWLALRERRRRVRIVGFAALAAILAQGLLGGLTVLFFLPTPIPVGHALLAQTFLLLIVGISYAESDEWQRRRVAASSPPRSRQVAWGVLLGALYLQLALGALMRHTEAGLAMLDWPANAGAMIPAFDSAMLQRINGRRFLLNLPSVTMAQVVTHFAHRVGALIVTAAVIVLNVVLAGEARREGGRDAGDLELGRQVRTVIAVDALLVVQLALGGLTVLSERHPFIASAHVVTGASLLALGFLGLLRALPTAWATEAGDTVRA